MKYLSLFSGIEAATVAWKPFGWEPIAFCEINEFSNTVLSCRFPNIQNLGDVTKVDWSGYNGKVDIIVGGSPCQSFSLAGRYDGLQGESKLMFEYIRAIREVMPRYFVWENVPGALTSENGKAFGQLLYELDVLGYGMAWLILDAQFFGVSQKRRRVFLVGCLGSPERAAEILFEPESMSWDYPQSKEKRQEIAREATKSIGKDCGSLKKETIYVIDRAAFNQGINSAYIPHIEETDVMDCLIAKGPHAVGIGEPLQVRTLTPIEYERLQGFPDDWTKVPYRGKSEEKCPKYARYKAVGNSMCVPVMRWIGERINKYEE